MMDELEVFEWTKEIEQKIREADMLFQSNSASAHYQMYFVILPSIARLNLNMEEDIEEQAIDKGICPICYLAGDEEQLEIIHEIDTGFSYYKCPCCGWNNAD